MKPKLLLAITSVFLTVLQLQAQLNYSFTNVVSSTEAYTDIAGTGTPIAMTSTTAGTSVTPQNIGFNFEFNGTPFTQFTMHADGIIRMGTANPGAATGISSSNNSTYFGAFTTTSASYQNIVMPFFTDLMAGVSTPEFHVLTTGTAPNRKCIIQYKNLKDSTVANGVVTPHFNNLEFQVHLFETTNDITFSYGNFAPTAASLAGRFACVGVKASSTAFVNLQKRSFHTWEKAIPFGTNITGEITGFAFRNNVPIANGFSYNIYSKRNTDISVAGFFVDAEIAQGTPVGNQLQAIIKNEGVNAVAAIPVTLTVTGANSFTETINVASLAAGTQQTVVFTPFVAANTGQQNITVSIAPAGDENLANNTQSIQQVVNNNTYRSADTAFYAGTGFGFNNGSGFQAQKVFSTGTKLITQIRVGFISALSQGRVYLFSDNGTGNAPGTQLFQSPTFISNDGNDFIIPVNPPISVTGNYYLAVQQITANANIGLKVRLRNILQPGRQYTSANGTSWSELTAHTGYYILEAKEQIAGVDVGIEQIVQPGCGYRSDDSVKVAVRNFSNSIHDYSANPVTINAFSVDANNTQFNFPAIIKSSGTIPANGYDTVVVATNYNTLKRGRYFFSAKTVCAADAANSNDSIGYSIVTSIPITRSLPDSICPFTSVILTGNTSYVSAFQWKTPGGVVLSFAAAIAVAPATTTTYFFEGTDFRGCRLSDSVVVGVRTLGIPEKPLIVSADPVLSYRNNFRSIATIANVAPLHTYTWFVNGVSTANVNNNRSFDLFNTPIDSSRILLRTVRNSDGCANQSDTFLVTYGKGILHNNNLAEIVSDTNYYDMGGVNNNYGNPANFTKTFTPADPAKKMRLVMYNQTFNFSGNAALTVYDGNSDAAPIIEARTSNQNGAGGSADGVSYMASNPTGALTIKFTNTSANVSSGFVAALRSESPLVFRSINTFVFTNFASVDTWQSKPIGSSTYTQATRIPTTGDDTIYINSNVEVRNVNITANQLVISANNNLTVGGSTTLRLYNPSAAYDIVNDGTITVEGFGNLITAAGSNNSKILNRSGIWLNPGSTFACDSLIMGAGNSVRIFNISAFNPVPVINARVQVNGTLATLTGNLIIANGSKPAMLHLVNGVLKTDANRPLVIGATSDIVGGSNLSYIDGPIRRRSLCNESFFRFPLGKDGVYRPLQLRVPTFPDCTTTNEVEAQLISGAPPTRTLPASLTRVSNVRYYNVKKISGNFTTANIELSYGPDDGVQNAAELRIAKDDGTTNWLNLGGTGTANGTGTITSTTGFTDFSDFVLANTGVVLPLTLLKFTGSIQNNAALLNWHTTNENNSSHFEIESSADARLFAKSGVVNAKGPGNNAYSFTHTNHLPTTFYRLKMVDIDGRFTFSPTVKLSQLKNQSVTVFPIPVADMVTVSGLQQNGFVKLFAGDGKLLQQQVVTAQSITLKMGHLPTGTYLLQYMADDKIIIQKIIKN